MKNAGGKGLRRVSTHPFLLVFQFRASSAERITQHERAMQQALQAAQQVRTIPFTEPLRSKIAPVVRGEFDL